MRLAWIAGIALVTVMPSAALAHEGHPHKVMGVIKTVDAAHLEIDAQDGTSVTVVLERETKFFRDKSAVAVADAKVGDRVAVTFAEKEGKKIAQEVLLGTAAPHAHH